MVAKKREPRDAPAVSSTSEFKKINIPVIEEVAAVKKRVVKSGRVRVSKRVLEHEDLIDEPLMREKVTVERVRLDKYVDATPEIRYEGDVMVIPVVQEQIVMQKKLLLREEVRVKKELVEMHEPQTVKLRKETVDVKRVAADVSDRNIEKCRSDPAYKLE